MEVTKFSFDELNMLSRLLANRAREYNFTHVIGIARGGLVPATIISYVLDIPLVTCSVSSYDDTIKGELTIQDDLNISKFTKDSKVLIVDDICDTGDTIHWITNKLTTSNIKHETACIFTKKKHVEKLKFYGSVVSEDKWIVFPWE